MKKKIYQYHRQLSIIIAFPVLLWALSGFMHPLMTNIRPKVAAQAIAAMPVDSSKIHVSLQTALKQNKIDSFSDFRLIHIDTNWFYQVQRAGDIPVYLSTKNGNLLSNGDWLYAQYLARQFLEKPGQKKPVEHTPQPAPAPGAHDCCDAATDCVLNPTQGTGIGSVAFLTAFDNEYKSVNKLLPVYKVAFERADGIRIYVETVQDRFAFAMDDKRAFFDKLFFLFHTWGWLSFLGKARFVIEFLLVFGAFCTTVMGIYIFFITKAKRSNGNAMVKTRRWHRFTSIGASLFTLFFTFSGAYHALNKVAGSETTVAKTMRNVAASSVNFDFPALQRAVQLPVYNVSLAQLGNQYFYRIVLQDASAGGKKDLMKDMQVKPSVVSYLDVQTLTQLDDGDRKYATALATQYSGMDKNSIQSVAVISKFNDAYNFTDKRLPVWELKYPGSKAYYIETSTGTLAKRLTPNDLAEGTVFALLHKHHFMDWGGKGLRDASTMFWAMVQVLMVIVGLVLFFRRKAALK